MTQGYTRKAAPVLVERSSILARLVHGLHARAVEVAVLARRGGGVSDQINPGVQCQHLPRCDMLDHYSRRIASVVADLSELKAPVNVARLNGFYDPRRYRHAHYWVGNTPAICDSLRQHGFPANRIRHIPQFGTAPKKAMTGSLLSLPREEKAASSQ